MVRSNNIDKFLSTVSDETFLIYQSLSNVWAFFKTIDDSSIDVVFLVSISPRHKN